MTGINGGVIDTNETLEEVIEDTTSAILGLNVCDNQIKYLKTTNKAGNLLVDDKGNAGVDSGSERFQDKCHHCGKYGHWKVDCWEKYGRPDDHKEQSNQPVEEVTDNEEQVALVRFYIEDNVEFQETEQSNQVNSENAQKKEVTNDTTNIHTSKYNTRSRP